MERGIKRKRRKLQWLESWEGIKQEPKNCNKRRRKQAVRERERERENSFSLFQMFSFESVGGLFGGEDRPAEPNSFSAGPGDPERTESEQITEDWTLRWLSLRLSSRPPPTPPFKQQEDWETTLLTADAGKHSNHSVPLYDTQSFSPTVRSEPGPGRLSHPPAALILSSKSNSSGDVIGLNCLSVSSDSFSVDSDTGWVRHLLLSERCQSAMSGWMNVKLKWKSSVFQGRVEVNRRTRGSSKMLLK